ncbi:ABC transporter ATP-binding protein [Clostridium sp. D2Q-11]|uniref:ABC transporter ATP-binding protein n=1 Tax=Anaeromonas frigoriresistens TaxID=2683708 RepID=A0A942Z858_9FIRM|nr:ABC transporter ATP-binding protein [Anaeromonas frigoriresistens]MBS4537605.1 ABC transporter ATP-binding protein [Anaeromonas frigoriresistens]
MLKIENIDAYYGFIHALKDFSINIEEGKIVTLLGANGAGKTSTLKVISGLLNPVKGSVTFNGENLLIYPPEKIVSMGIIQSPEGRQIFPQFTVEENLKAGAYTRKDKENIAKTLDKVYDYFPRLKERKKQYAGTLSGGEQQMLAIGRALMAKPKLLLLDEPSLGLAPLIVRDIFRIIEEINKEGTTILLVEQNAYQALSIADYGYILETGKVVSEGSAKELLGNSDIKKAYLGGN